MSFRNQQDDLDAWRKQNQRQLILLGMPEEIVFDKRRLILAVQNNDDPETGWNSDWIPQNHVHDLRTLLLQKFDHIGWDLVSALERRTKQQM